MALTWTDYFNTPGDFFSQFICIETHAGFIRFLFKCELRFIIPIYDLIYWSFLTNAYLKSESIICLHLCTLLHVCTAGGSKRLLSFFKSRHWLLEINLLFVISLTVPMIPWLSVLTVEGVIPNLYMRSHGVVTVSIVWVIGCCGCHHPTAKLQCMRSGGFKFQHPTNTRLPF